MSCQFIASCQHKYAFTNFHWSIYQPAPISTSCFCLWAHRCVIFFCSSQVDVHMNSWAGFVPRHGDDILILEAWTWQGIQLSLCMWRKRRASSLASTFDINNLLTKRGSGSFEESWSPGALVFVIRDSLRIHIDLCSAVCMRWPQPSSMGGWQHAAERPSGVPLAYTGQRK